MTRLAITLLFAGTSMFAVELGKPYRFADGKEAFQKVCAHCHTLKTAPHSIFTKMDDAAGVKARAEGIFQTVRHGSNAMPAFRKSEIDDATLMELATKLADGTIADPTAK